MMAAATSFEKLTASRPEWRSWLRLLAEVRRACADVRWRESVPDVRVRESAPDAIDGQPLGAPRLAGAAIPLDDRLAGDLVRGLALAAAATTGPAATLRTATITNDIAVRLLEASVNEDAARLGEFADGLGVDRGAFGAVSALAAAPLLHACRRTWNLDILEDWAYGYCPVCGAWPTLAESCGLHHARLLRCGRCGSGWPGEWLCCPYCGMRDHGRLGVLVPQVGGESRKVETCLACRGYVKTLAVLKPSAPIDVALRDLETVELDVAALERGFMRMTTRGYRLDVTVAPAARSGLIAALLGRRA